MDETRDFIRHRREKAAELRGSGINPYANTFRAEHTTAQVTARFAGQDRDRIEACQDMFSLAGRVVSLRSFGKAAFVHLQDRSGRLQAYVRKNEIGEDNFAVFKKVDIGDFIGVRGRAFLTRSDELTIQVCEFSLLTKSLRPLPEKWHGLQDVETRYRQRYLDLIVNENVRRTFQTRSRIITLIRRFLEERGFQEVETPMMHPIPGGATAQPFKTHHNALDMELYMRIAPELYLKRLLVGGLERVFEINRNFRNEGIDLQHNPEFTMLEVYQAYGDYESMMRLAEDLIVHIAQEVCGGLELPFGDATIDYTPPWPRRPFWELLEEHAGVHRDNEAAIRALAHDLETEGARTEHPEYLAFRIFEKTVEDGLIAPTFVVDYPKSISPLARAKPGDPELAQRFELFIAGMEIAPAYTELNDPLEQEVRFREQVGHEEERERIDRDFLRALAFGMPPAGGMGVGIDRLVMALTNTPSIRDVILFPLLRPEEGA